MIDFGAAAKSGEVLDVRTWIGGMRGMRQTKKILGTGKHEAASDVFMKLGIDLKNQRCEWGYGVKRRGEESFSLCLC